MPCSQWAPTKAQEVPRIVRYTCKNTGCTRTPKMVRARYIFDSLYEILEQINVTDEVYNEYGKRIDTYTAKKMAQIRTQINSLSGAITHRRNTN